MNRWELLLLALALWTALGLAGTVLALVRRERQKALRGAFWIAGVWILYLAAELSVAKFQKQRVFALGQSKCFDEMCFSISKVEEVPGFFGRNAPNDGTKLLRVSVSIENRGRNRTQREGLVRAYLLDRAGRRWSDLPGLDSVPLTSPVTPGHPVMSQPIFRIPDQCDVVGLVLTHGYAQPGVLVMGDSDSLGHLPDIFALGALH